MDGDFNEDIVRAAKLLKRYHRDAISEIRKEIEKWETWLRKDRSFATKLEGIKNDTQRLAATRDIKKEK